MATACSTFALGLALAGRRLVAASGGKTVFLQPLVLHGIFCPETHQNIPVRGGALISLRQDTYVRITTSECLRQDTYVRIPTSECLRQDTYIRIRQNAYVRIPTS